jgi:hypothetical protein
LLKKIAIAGGVRVYQVSNASFTPSLPIHLRARGKCRPVGRRA